MDVRKGMYPAGYPWLLALGYSQRLLAGKPCLARLFLQVCELLLRGLQGLLLAVDLVLLFAGIFGKLGLVAQHGAGVAIKRGSTQPGFALRDVQFALQRS